MDGDIVLKKQVRREEEDYPDDSVDDKAHTVLDRDIKSRTTSTTSTISTIVSIKLSSLLNCRVRES